MPRPSAPARALLLCVLCALSGCPGGDQGADGGAADSGPVASVPCSGPADCATGACRNGACENTPCGDDVECALGESCQAGFCRFTGCTKDSDCATGRCRAEVFACAECGTSQDCPSARPVCSPSGACVLCASDDQCQPPGPRYCNAVEGACVQCLTDVQCQGGMTCGTDHQCHGQPFGASCEGTLCDQGLVCVSVNRASSTCQKGCNLYHPDCASTELCLKLTTTYDAFIFEGGAPLGVCHAPLAGAKYYKETCTTAGCQPNLICEADSATSATCKAYCDPAQPNCGPGEICHRFPADYAGHEIGICYANNGFGDACGRESDCRANQSCMPAEDPSSYYATTQCGWSVPDGGAPLSPCTADRDCRTGLCANDVSHNTGLRMCFGACTADSDCASGENPGYCDAYSDVTFPDQTPAEVLGCRPSCADQPFCDGYDAGLACQVQTRYLSGAYVAQRVCGLPSGAGLPGDSCASNAGCASNLCILSDARFQARAPGYCSAPCSSATSCHRTLADGGVAGLSGCLDTPLPLSTGADFIPNTPDDVVAIVKACSPPACQSAADCPALAPLCAVDTDPSSKVSSLVLRCRAPTAGSLRAGDSCTVDAQCQSGACADLSLADGGTVKGCFEPCDAVAGTCPGSLLCRPGGAVVRAKDGTGISFTACVP